MSETIIRFFNSRETTFKTLNVFFEFTKNSYRIINANIKGDLHFFALESNFSYGIEFVNCLFRGAILFSSSDFDSAIKFTNCDFVQQINFLDGNFKPIMFLKSNLKEVNLSSGTLEYLSFEECNLKNLSIGLIDRQKNTSSINIKHLDIHSHSVLRGGFDVNCNYFLGRITLRSITVNSFFITGLIEKSCEIQLNFVKVNKLTISNIINEGRLRMFGVTALLPFVNDFIPTKMSYVDISDSNLAKAEFFNVDFDRGFRYLLISDSVLYDCLFINIKWPKDILTAHPDPFPRKIIKNKIIKHISKEKFLQVKDNYRQIKYALSKQGDIIGEHLFHSKEMEAYLKGIKWWPLSSSTLVIFLSHKTSNFGQSLLRPFITLLLLGIPLFSFLVFFNQINGVHFVNPSKYSVSGSFNTVAEFVNILNPLHKNVPELKGFPFLIDVSIRIISSFCIYNIIRATRRFIK